MKAERTSSIYINGWGTKNKMQKPKLESELDVNKEKRIKANALHIHRWMDRNAYFTWRPKTGSWVYGYGCHRD